MSHLKSVLGTMYLVHTELLYGNILGKLVGKNSSVSKIYL